MNKSIIAHGQIQKFLNGSEHGGRSMKRGLGCSPHFSVFYMLVEEVSDPHDPPGCALIQ